MKPKVFLLGYAKHTKTLPLTYNSIGNIKIAYVIDLVRLGDFI